MVRENLQVVTARQSRLAGNTFRDSFEGLNTAAAAYIARVRPQNSLNLEPDVDQVEEYRSTDESGAS